MKLKKIFASAFAAVAAITSVASLTSCKKDDDVTDDGGNDQGGNENDAAAEIQAKLEAAINGLSVKSSYEADFTLPTTAAGGVTISWASNNVDVVKIENGKVTITRPGLTEADATVKITATAVIDGETKTKEFTITIPHKTPDDITSKVTNENGYINIPFGAIKADGTYTIKVAEGKTITIEYTGFTEKSSHEEFGVAKKGETSNAIKITTSGVKLDALIADVYGSYDNMKCYIGSDNTGTNVKGTVRYDKGTEYTYLFSNDAEAVYFENPSDYEVLFYDLTLVVEDSYVAPAAPQVIEKTIAEALEFVSKQGYNMYTNDYYKLTGTVTEIQNDTYGNVVISDGTNSILIYGMYDTNNNRFDKMATKPAVGDTIVVQGILGNFQGTAQIKNGTLLEIQLTDAQKAEKEAKALAALIETEYDYAEEIKLASTVGTLAVTVQSGATALSFADGVLAINPTATEVTETVTISVTVGEETKTATVNVKTKAYAPEAGTFTVDGKYTAGTTTNMVEEKNNAKIIGLKPAVFNVTTDKIVYPSYSNTIGLNKDGSIRLYSNTQDGAKGDGNELTIALKDFAGYDLKITKITLTFGTGKNTPTFTVNGVAGSTSTAEYTINDSTVVIKNTTETSAQLWITNIKVEYTVVENTPVEYTVDLTKTEFNLKDEATMPTVEYDVYASVWGGTAATGTFIPVDADGKFEVIGSFTGALLVLIKKGETPAWSGDAFLAQTINYTVDGTTVNAPFDGTEEAVEYTVDLTKIQYNLSTETTLPSEYDVYVSVWGDGATASNQLTAVNAEGKFEILGDFTKATIVLIKKGETPAWEGEAFIAKTKDYTLTDTTIAGPFDGTEQPTSYLLDLATLNYNLADNATMPTEYDLYATVWGGTATTGTFIPVTLNGSFEVLGTFTGLSFYLMTTGEDPVWEGTTLLAKTNNYSLVENKIVAPVVVTQVSIEDAIEIGLGQAEYGVYTEELYEITGFITEIKNTTFGNMYISDGVNTIYVYGLYDTSGNKYGEMTTKPVVGDKVTIYGGLGKYNGAAQYSNATLLTITQDEEAFNEIFVKIEAERLAGLIDTTKTYDIETMFDLSSTAGTVVITPQTGATTLTVEGTTLKVTPGSTETTETVTITVTIGQETYTTESISIKSLASTSIFTEINSSYFVNSYNTTEKTLNLDGYTWGYMNIANYGNGVQVAKNSLGQIYNKDALNGNIQKIVFEWSSSRDSYTNENYLKIELGNDNTYSGATQFLSTVAGEKTYTINVTGEYTMVRLTNVLSYVQYWDSIKIYYDGEELTDEQKAQNEANRLIGLFDSTKTYEEETEFDFTPAIGTVVITPQTGATTLTVTDNVLKVTPASTETTETFTIAVTVGQNTYTTDAISVTSLVAAIKAGSYTVTTCFDGTGGKVESTVDASFVGLSTDLFTIASVKNDASNLCHIAEGDIRFYHDGNSDANDTEEVGSTLTISAKNLSTKGFVLTITSISFTFSSNSSYQGTLALNGTAIEGQSSGATVSLTLPENSTTFTLSNIGSQQCRIGHITINYTITEANA